MLEAFIKLIVVKVQNSFIPGGSLALVCFRSSSLRTPSAAADRC